MPNIATAFGIFLMRQLPGSLPDEILDAARVDGASEFEIYWRIVLPLHARYRRAEDPRLRLPMEQLPLAAGRRPHRHHWTVPVGLNSLRVYASSAQVINMQMAGATLASSRW